MTKGRVRPPAGGHQRQGTGKNKQTEYNAPMTRLYRFEITETATTRVEINAISEREALQRIEEGDPTVVWFDAVRGPVRLVRRPDGGS